MLKRSTETKQTNSRNNNQRNFPHLDSSEDDEHGVLSLSSSNIERRRLAIVLKRLAIVLNQKQIESLASCNFAFLFSRNEYYDFAAISMATKSLTNNTGTEIFSVSLVLFHS